MGNCPMASIYLRSLHIDKMFYICLRCLFVCLFAFLFFLICNFSNMKGSCKGELMFFIAVSQLNKLFSD